MRQGDFFCHLNSDIMVNFIQSAKRAVVYAAPSIQTLPAKAMIEVSKRLGKEMLTVNLDVDERVIRMGYGELEAIQLLQNAEIVINHSPQLRSALLLVDNEGFSFTPTPLYLEAENNNLQAYNAIRLTAEQVKEALARLSPVAKSIAIAQAETKEEKQRLKEISVDLQSTPVKDTLINQVAKNLDEAPPVKFDVTRQVRVYESYLQYVEMKLSGAAIQRHRLTIPKSLQRIGKDNDEIEGRLRTTFELIKKDDALSSKSLENWLSEIRENFTPSLGKKHGRVLLKKAKPLFEERITEFKEHLKSHRKKVEKELETKLNESKKAIIDYYFPLVKNNPPDSLQASVLNTPTEDDFKRWIEQELDKTFPSVNKLINFMQLEVSYKDITFESLNEKSFS